MSPRTAAAKVPTARHSAPKSKPANGLDIDEMLANAQMASEFLKALSHEVRLLILCFLIEGEKSVPPGTHVAILAIGTFVLMRYSLTGAVHEPLERHAPLPDAGSNAGDVVPRP